MTRQSITRRYKQATASLAVAALVSLSACSSSDGSSDSASNTGGDNTTPPPVTQSTTVSGTAATGAPIAGGTVNVVCASGAPVSTTTSSTGDFTVVLPNAVAPCAFQVSGGNLPVGTTYHSLLASFADTNIANITPLTDLMMANLLGTTPSSWFASVTGSDLVGITPTHVEAALTQLRTQLQLQTVNAAFNTLDPVRTQFTAQTGNAIDDLLEALIQAMSTAQLTYGDLLSAAKDGLSLQTQFQQALATAYAQITNSGGGGSTGTGGGTDTGGGSTGGTSGTYTLTLNVTANGVAIAPVVIQNVPKPANESEFCNELNDQTSALSLNQFMQDGVSGSLTINSCAFNGSVGNVSATLAITTPYQINVPYSVVYTYN